MILKNGNILYQGEKDAVLTKENIKMAFDIDVDLLPNSNGRLWAVVK